MIYGVFVKRELCQKIEINGCNKFEPCDLKDIADDKRLLFQKLNNIVENVSNNSSVFKLINYILEWKSYILKFECGVEEFISFPTYFFNLDYRKNFQKY